MVTLAPALSGCSYVRAYHAKKYYAQYQAAIANGDLRTAQLALLMLVRNEEDVADFWVQLGKIDLQLGAYRDGYDALLHAHELDRTNVEVVATMAQLAAFSGQIDMAEQDVKNLSLVAPDHPAVTLVNGFIDLSRGNLDKAGAAADQLLASSPNDSMATLLKGRVLVKSGKPDDAIVLLERQRQVQPDDRSALRALIAIYKSKEDWRNATRVALDLYKLNPRDSTNGQQLIEAALSSGNVNLATQVSKPLLTPGSPAASVASILDLWARFAPHKTPLPEAVPIAQRHTGETRVDFADYLNRIGRPDLGIAVLGEPKLPITHENASANGVLAQSLALQGQTDQARKLFDQVLSVEPDQLQALRGRSALLAKTGNTKQAIIDAQRLVTANPGDGGDRVILAQAYFAAGQRQDVRRTLWNAFQDMPQDERVFASLRSVLVSTGDIDGERRLRREIYDRRVNALEKDIV